MAKLRVLHGLSRNVDHFHVALLRLGVGWNFLFIGATTLLTKTGRPSERARAQGLNDFIVFTTVAAAAIASGVLHHRFGWRTVNLAVVPMLAAVILSIGVGLRVPNDASMRHGSPS
ncbi:MAG: hypothetical protein KUG77_23050 [Nannocystaceae bacterium]|nr:hypothetical protein [Nannocystaceae bacterium]